MSKLSFFYESGELFNLSLEALQRRNYKVVEQDAANGIIRAKSNGGLLKPSVALEIQIKQVSPQQTTLDIETKVGRNFKSSHQRSATEKKFIYTLYKCFERI